VQSCNCGPLVVEGVAWQNEVSRSGFFFGTEHMTNGRCKEILVARNWNIFKWDDISRLSKDPDFLKSLTF
jgi:hypothetical protein